MLTFFTQFQIRSLRKKITGLANLRRHNPASSQDIAKEVLLLRQLAELYKKNRFNKKIPFAYEMALECYRQAAILEDAQSRYDLGRDLLEKARFFDELKETNFNNKTLSKYAEDTFEESFAYLEAAQNQEFFLAKRLRGLAFINGWGVEMDREQGFKLVIESIEQEGAWDRATEIFKELGLNKPEFFSYIMSSNRKN